MNSDNKKLAKLFNSINIVTYGETDYVSNSIIRYGCWESNVTDTILQLLNISNNSTKIFFDVGCFIGYYSLLLQDLCDYIHSFDANEININLLKESIELNGFTNIITNNNMISSSIIPTEYCMKNLDIVNKNGNYGGLSYKKGIGENTIKSLNLDQYITDNNITHIDVIKIDIEGFELEALEGLEQSLTNGIIYNLVIELTTINNKENSIKILNKLEKYYSIYDIGLKETGYYTNEIDINKFKPISPDRFIDFIVSVKIQTNILARKK